MSTATVILKTDISSSTSTWTFGTDGDLTLAGGNVFFSNEPDSTVMYNNGISVSSGTQYGTTVQGNTAGINQYWFADGTMPTKKWAAVRVNSPEDASTGSVVVSTGAFNSRNNWIFAHDGSTVLPENTLKGYCFTATNAVVNYIPQAGAFYYTDNPILRSIATIGGAWYIKGPGLVGWKQITGVQDNGTSLIIRIGGGLGPLPDGSEFHSGNYLPNSPDLVYTISQYLDLDIKAADKTWTFSENGSLTFPTSPDITTTWTSPTDFPGYGVGPMGSGCVLTGPGSSTGRINIKLTDPAKQTAWLALAIGVQVTVIGTGIVPSPLTLVLTGVSGQDGDFYYQEFSTPGAIYQDQYSSISSVSFTIAGTGFSVTPLAITFPNNTVQTTAYKSTSGSWTLATGSNTVSITVPLNGNYQMWVNGTIPNGIVEWNATVNVSNPNVPVIGSQYGWYYYVGNALVLTAIPNQIVGTVGVISTATVSTTTSNVFTFGIRNNSTSTQTVNWGYTTL
jgi:hypothetical protein